MRSSPASSPARARVATRTPSWSLRRDREVVVRRTRRSRRRWSAASDWTRQRVGGSPLGDRATSRRDDSRPRCCRRRGRGGVCRGNQMMFAGACSVDETCACSGSMSRHLGADDVETRPGADEHAGQGGQCRVSLRGSSSYQPGRAPGPTCRRPSPPRRSPRRSWGSVARRSHSEPRPGRGPA